MGCFAVEGAVWSVEVVEVFLFAELGLEIDVALVGQKLVELLLV